MRKNGSFSGAMACVGAVIGAGFASGREIVGFFTRYGEAAPGLILLAAAVMTGLCALVMRRCGGDSWCVLFDETKGWTKGAAEGCILLLAVLTGGAMISAAGHMVSLLWAGEWAYAIGAVGTLAAAWWMAGTSMRPLSWMSAVLTALLLLCLCAAFGLSPAQGTVVEAEQPGLIWGAARAAAYAAMNLTLAIGVVCRLGTARAGRTSMTFGGMMAVLLLLSHAVYARHPALYGEAFPLVRLLAAFGRGGFLLSAVLMYLSVFTSLTAVVCALRSGIERRISHPWAAAALAMGLPLAVSCIGFAGIVDGLYAPAGLACLACIYWPLHRRQ